MSKSLFILLLLPCAIFADSRNDALKAREQVMLALKGFNPATTLKDYTTNPREASLLPNEGNNQLTNQGQDALGREQSANEIYQKATSREKVPTNPNSPEMRYAEHLLENPDIDLDACTDKQCDSSLAETSDDIQEGLSRLGVLAGSAGDVSSKQVKSGVAAIFTGNSQECKKYPLGFRDCCTDSGWGDWVKHCPQDLQILQRAKQENRVVYLGDYKPRRFGSRHYTYCIFPSKLAAIVQIQGRGGQLGISYGSAKYPNCRGLTPEELERINFSALDLSPLQQELMARMALPANGQIGANNQAKVERLKREGRSHD